MLDSASSFLTEESHLGKSWALGRNDTHCVLVEGCYADDIVALRSRRRPNSSSALTLLMRASASSRLRRGGRLERALGFTSRNFLSLTMWQRARFPNTRGSLLFING